MNIRLPVAAGSFYESSPSSCERHALALVESARIDLELPATLYGGVVPHAGWTYSGELAAMTLNSLAQARPLERLVLLGADHTGSARMGEVFDSGVWRTPLGEVHVDQELAAALVSADQSLRANPSAHRQEHSLEVMLPLLQVVSPGARIVAVAVPPTELAVQVGRAVGSVLRDKFPQAVVVASSDLTHYGGGRFAAPGGRGEAGEKWAARNDERILDRIAQMDAPGVIREASQNENACGAGAIAAAIEACSAMGAKRGILLKYTNSYRVSHALYPSETDDTTVGYASVVFA